MPIVIYKTHNKQILLLTLTGHCSVTAFSEFSAEQRMTTLSTAAETWNLKSTRDENPAEPFIFGETDSCVGTLLPRWSGGNVV